MIPKYILRVTIQETPAIVTTIEYELLGESSHPEIPFLTFCDILDFIKEDMLIRVEYVKLQREVITTLINIGEIRFDNSAQ